MIPYLIVLAIIGALAATFHFFPSQIKTRKTFLILSALILILFMGFRGESVGADTAAYSDYYRWIAESSNPSRFMNIVTVAPIYSLLNKALGFISPDPQILLLVAAAITCICALFFIHTFSDNAYFSVFLFVALYFYINCFNGMRQGMAIALCILAFALMFRGKTWLSFIALLFAAGIHLTSLIILPFLFLCKKDWTLRSFKRFFCWALCITIVIFIFIPLMLKLFVTLVPRYAQYSDFLLSEEYKTTGRNVFRTLFYAGVLIAFFVGIERNNRKTNTPSQKDLKILIPAVCGVLIALVFFDNYLLCERIASYLLIFMIIIIPNVLKYIALPKATVAYSVICCTVACALFFILLIGNYAEVVPYVFFWF